MFHPDGCFPSSPGTQFMKPDVFFPAEQWTANLSATSRETCRPMTCSFALENGKPGPR